MSPAEPFGAVRTPRPEADERVRRFPGRRASRSIKRAWRKPAGEIRKPEHREEGSRTRSRIGR
jgi:hypothetical protein